MIDWYDLHVLCFGLAQGTASAWHTLGEGVVLIAFSTLILRVTR